MVFFNCYCINILYCVVVISILYEFCIWYSMFYCDELWIPGWLEHGRSSKLARLIWNMLTADHFKVHLWCMWIKFIFQFCWGDQVSFFHACVCLLFVLILLSCLHSFLVFVQVKSRMMGDSSYKNTLDCFIKTLKNDVSCFPRFTFLTLAYMLSNLIDLLYYNVT